jgi:hypothetical protein
MAGNPTDLINTLATTATKVVSNNLNQFVAKDFEVSF